MEKEKPFAAVDGNAAESTRGPLSAARLSETLKELRVEFAHKPLTVGELEQSLQGRGFALLILLMTLPSFLVPIPGLATPFGIAIFLMGARVAFGQRPWLPQFVLRKSITGKRLTQLLDGGIRIASFLERIIRPRWQFVLHWPGMPNVIGVSIALGALLLALPLPIPFANWVPAFAVFLLAAGLMERDGLFVVLGHTVCGLAWLLLALWFFLGMKGIGAIIDSF